jgi:hypothetical protein
MAEVARFMGFETPQEAIAHQFQQQVGSWANYQAGVVAQQQAQDVVAAQVTVSDGEGQQVSLPVAP